MYIYIFCVFFAISWATPAVYGGSQTSGPIGAVAASLCQSHNNSGSEPRLQPTPQLTATYTSAHGNAGSLTHWARLGIEPATSWFLVGFVNHCAMTGTPKLLYFNIALNKSINSGPLLRDAVFIYFICLFYFLSCLGPHLWQMKVPRLGAESEL